MRLIIDLLRKGALLVIMLAAGGYFVYAYAVPCKAPVRYTVGAVDSRFNSTEEELKSALADAERIWEKAAGTELFRYDADARMPVNLVYDSRQAITQKNSSIKEVVDEKSETADSVKRAYDQANRNYQAAKPDYLSAQSSYEAELKAYNDKVAYWNQRGGAPAKEYQALQAQKAALQRSADALEEKRVALNTLADQVNALSARYNTLAEQVNQGVETINQTAGREFEEGLYTKNAFSARIDIFEYSGRDELVRVLAHELGHALGLDHNDNPDSIMYELNQSENVTPTAEDMAALKAACGL